eukprot:SAG11_NODE_103_length_16571_cov_49.569208_7_plen_184_part_00
MLLSGRRQIRLVAIRKRYLQRWFAVDFLSIMPINYILMAVETEDSRSNANDTLAEGEASDSNNSDLSALKALRLFRFSKMLRLCALQPCPRSSRSRTPPTLRACQHILSNGSRHPQRAREAHLGKVRGDGNCAGLCWYGRAALRCRLRRTHPRMSLVRPWPAAVGHAFVRACSTLRGAVAMRS